MCHRASQARSALMHSAVVPIVLRERAGNQSLRCANIGYTLEVCVLLCSSEVCSWRNYARWHWGLFSFPVHTVFAKALFKKKNLQINTLAAVKLFTRSPSSPLGSGTINRTKCCVQEPKKETCTKPVSLKNKLKALRTATYPFIRKNFFLERVARHRKWLARGGTGWGSGAGWTRAASPLHRTGTPRNSP